jgi:hypothetical protein
MRCRLFVVLCCCLAAVATAELQSVEVGGELRIRGRWWRNVWNAERVPVYPDSALGRRPLGPFGATTQFRIDGDQNARAYLEQRTRLNVRARFTGDVSAFFELEAFHRVSGFRSNVVTGQDFADADPSGVNLFQAHIDVARLFGSDLGLRIGRQTLRMGKGWLIGDAISPCLGLSFDAFRLYWDADPWRVDAWAAKLAENSDVEVDGDVDFYGVYAEYGGLDALHIAGYWFWLRDARDQRRTRGAPTTEWIESLLGWDDYDVTNLHTVGIRLNGTRNGWDYDLEVARQQGNADHRGSLFTRDGYGDTGACYKHWALDVEAGHTFERRFTPRVFLGGAWFEGDDHRAVSAFDYYNPLATPRASVSFNRLFSSVAYNNVLDILGGSEALSNFFELRGGLQVHWTDAVVSTAKLAHYWVDAPFRPPRRRALGGFTPHAFLTRPGERPIGWTSTLLTRYAYSDDLAILVGWEHFEPGPALLGGAYIFKNGTEIAGGTKTRASDYLWFDIGLRF